MTSLSEPQDMAIHCIIGELKLPHAAQGTRRILPWALAVSAVGIIRATSFGVLYASHRHGAVSTKCWPLMAVPTCAFHLLDGSPRSPEDPDSWIRLSLATGGAVTGLLFILSSRFVWWPLSPIGFIIASVWHTNHGLRTATCVAGALTGVIRRLA